VTNRRTLLGALQSLEAASIIGLTRRTQSLSGHTRIVAGVLGMFRKHAVLGVGGYDGRMATEDIDLTWRLLLDGWLTVYEPNALIGMQVPTTLSGLWRQRCRWARGQGEVLHEHLWDILIPRRWRIWSVGIETFLSLAWVIGLVLAVVAIALAFALDRPTVFGYGIAWGIGISIVCMLQLGFAVALEARYDRPALLVFLLGPLYPLGYWAISAAAALREELPAIVRGPREAGICPEKPPSRSPRTAAWRAGRLPSCPG
jgi:biofilm PGA synthesis N-glycosyltransferase PgaC